MEIKVLFFGVLKDLAGRNSENLVLPEGATAADLLSHYESQIQGAQSVFSSIAISVNQEYSTPAARLKSGDEVALLPPVSGGIPRVEITHDRIDTQSVVAKIKAGEDGAIVAFEGIVRNHSRGRRALFLEYEAYQPMALKEMESLADQALARFQIRQLAIVHRLGHLDIGETSVLIVVASAHRAAAFDACRWLIDTLKRTVPIWKKEHFADGAVWADGGPFPEEISSALEPSRIRKPLHPSE